MRAGHFPINAMIDTWVDGRATGHWEQVRDHWVLAHAARSVLALAAFTLPVVLAGTTRPGTDRRPTTRREKEVSHSLPG